MNTFNDRVDCAMADIPLIFEDIPPDFSLLCDDKGNYLHNGRVGLSADDLVARLIRKGHTRKASSVAVQKASDNGWLKAHRTKIDLPSVLSRDGRWFGEQAFSTVLVMEVSEEVFSPTPRSPHWRPQLKKKSRIRQTSKRTPSNLQSPYQNST